ncbi:RNA polymerase sigma factor [Plebeiibacterium marinum]|uniref:RNA polymerase sigma-70 factor n=1 Tax=Plebeiibacterium marinum TaxID=2992111 RepID=A0AAE3SIC6_9BACT|nr:RNA polymerase sigma-70 factor [Plebeiobacterium marinum]MCW3804472.1 RNA polymerase sigma-70 factor [Plebeiobacterium marinum]
MEAKKSTNISIQLIQRLKEGDIKAYEHIYNYYSESLYHFAYSYLKNPSESEEIVQEVFVRIWEIREGIDENKSFKSFLYKMTVNKVYNQMKHQVVEQKYEKYLMNYYQASANLPEESLQYKELNQKIQVLLEKLPDQQRNIFNLSRIEGLTNPKISEKLGLSIRTVENQIYRATKYLKQHLKEEYHLAVFCLLYFIK